MVAANAGSSRPQRRIALIKPRFAADEQAGHAVQLFDSVLWVFKGTTQLNWLASTADDAHLLVVHHTEPAAHIETWRRAGKSIITLSTDETNHPVGPRTLLYPFPAAQVLSMLERVEAEMDGGTASVKPESPAAAPGQQRGDPWSFVEALRTLHTLSNSTLWLECKGTRGTLLWIRGDGQRYFCDDSTAGAIAAGGIDLSGLTLQKGTTPPNSLQARAGSDLLWFAAYHASAELAPSLSEQTSLRLLRWPDFGRVRARDEASRTAQLRIVAALAESPLSVAALLRRAQANVEHTMRTVNALTSCALVETANASAATAVVPKERSPAPAGGLRQFLRNLRKQLRLGASR